MGRAKGRWGIWQGGSEEHPRPWAVTSEATQPDAPSTAAQMGLRIFWPSAALRSLARSLIPSPDVIHNRTERSNKVKRREVVNNSALRYKGGGARSATPTTQLKIAIPTRVIRRTLASAMAPAQKSERTTPYEGFCISLTGSSAKAVGGVKLKPKGIWMKPWNEFTHFGALDWASDHHDVIVLDAGGQMVSDFRFEHTVEGWQTLREKLAIYPALAMSVETSQGLVVEQLLQTNATVYPISPRSAKAYRTRKTTSGTKTDRLDAWSLASALRSDGHEWRALMPMDPLTQQLRLLCRDEVELIGQRTALINQLQAALREYYPVALEAFEDWTQAYTWAFVNRFPTPQLLVKAGKRQWEKFLHLHKLARPETYEKRLKAFGHAKALTGSDATIQAKSLLAISLVRMLRVLETQLELYRDKIQQLFDQHTDRDLFGSLPGAGPKLAPRLAAEIGNQRTCFPDAKALQCYAGTAPVSYQSGQIQKTHLRRMCNKHLRCTIHLMANLSRSSCPWAEIYYQALRKKGKSHASALRCLGQRWLKIIWKMWQTRTTYNADIHTQNQIKHGSWILQLQPS